MNRLSLYEGYDFIHFCSLSIPVMVTEVTARIGYAVKKIKQGNAIKDSIPISLNREKHPKLATMLFVSHSAAAAANTGKIYFTKNPMAINYPQWIAFGKYAYNQLRWILIEKPEARDAYVMDAIDSEFRETIVMIDRTFEEFSEEYQIIMA